MWIFEHKHTHAHTLTHRNTRSTHTHTHTQYSPIGSGKGGSYSKLNRFEARWGQGINFGQRKGKEESKK